MYVGWRAASIDFYTTGIHAKKGDSVHPVVIKQKYSDV